MSENIHRVSIKVSIHIDTNKRAIDKVIDVESNEEIDLSSLCEQIDDCLSLE